MKKITLLALPLLFCGSALFAQTNMVVNGDFSNGTEGWKLTYQTATDEGTLYKLSTSDNSLIIAQGATVAGGRLDIEQDIAVEPGKTYKISFDYQSTHKKLRIWSFGVTDEDKWVYVTGGSSGAASDPFRTNNDYFPVAEEWTTKSYEYTVPTDQDVTKFKLAFRAYKQANSSHGLRNISMVEATDAGVANVKGANQVYATNGVLMIDGEGGQAVDVFSLLGYKLASLTSSEGVTRVEGLPSNEVLMVRVKDKAYKVIIR